MTSRGVVRSWDEGGMQGVIDSADTPGGSWTSWTSVVVHGFPGLVEGQEVEFEWNQLDEAADGYDFTPCRRGQSARTTRRRDRPVSGLGISIPTAPFTRSPI
nr:hypothetical protein [Rhodococcus erythropolis]